VSGDPTPRDLWHVTDALVNTARTRLDLDDQPARWVRLPSLWDQLHDAVESGAGAQTGGRGQQSKPPCDSSALSLLIEIATAVRDGCHAAHLRRTRDVPKDLRQIVSDVIRRADPASYTTAHVLIRGWVARVKVTISNDPDRTWRMHGASCRVCASTSVPVWEDGEETRQPALIVHSEHGVIDRVECSYCGTVLTGDDLTLLLYDTLKRQKLTGTVPGI
jgi:hypothetical protein